MYVLNGNHVFKSHGPVYMQRYMYVCEGICMCVKVSVCVCEGMCVCVSR